ncbi:MAG TPA: hypothetical protein VFO27_17170, partial [Bryobacteraceae bacterium]|nr:hypothetical protein [Bryobacteraceae bacterium]
HQSCTDKSEEWDDGSNGSWRGVSGRPGGGIRGAKNRPGRHVPRDGARTGDKTSNKTVVVAGVFTFTISFQKLKFYSSAVILKVDSGTSRGNEPYQFCS